MSILSLRGCSKQILSVSQDTVGSGQRDCPPRVRDPQPDGWSGPKPPGHGPGSSSGQDHLTRADGPTQANSHRCTHLVAQQEIGRLAPSNTLQQLYPPIPSITTPTLY